MSPGFEMQFGRFLRKRREELDISQAKVADLLTELGQETSAARVGHWETGRNKPPLHDPDFRFAIAQALKMNVNEMMYSLGLEVAEEYISQEARIAAAIIDRLPETERSKAIDFLHLLEKWSNESVHS